MRTSLVAASVATVFAAASARAQEEVNPYAAPETATVAVPAAPTVTVAAPPVAVVPGAPLPQAPPVVLQPYGVPLPAAPQVAPTPGYYYPPPGYGAPIYSYPPPPVYYVRPTAPPRRLACASCRPAPAVKARFFSLGAHGTVMGINQKINGSNVVLGGAGLQMRFRTRGRFAMELAVDFLHGGFGGGGDGGILFASGGPDGSSPPSAAGTTTGTTSNPTGPYFHVGPVTRDSIPVTLSTLVYIFPNDDARVFNLYFLGGVGIVPTKMGLTDEWGASVKQSFTEMEAHLGLGLELRFRWFALQADVRGLGLFRDDSNTPGAWYTGVAGAPVPEKSWAVQGNAGVAIWF